MVVPTKQPIQIMKGNQLIKTFTRSISEEEFNKLDGVTITGLRLTGMGSLICAKYMWVTFAPRAPPAFGLIAVLIIGAAAFYAVNEVQSLKKFGEFFARNPSATQKSLAEFPV